MAGIPDSRFSFFAGTGGGHDRQRPSRFYCHGARIPATLYTSAKHCYAGRFAGGVCGRFWFGARIQHHAVLVLRFEAEDAAGMSRIQAEFRTALLAIDKTLKLPF